MIVVPTVDGPIDIRTRRCLRGCDNRSKEGEEEQSRVCHVGERMTPVRALRYAQDDNVCRLFATLWPRVARSGVAQHVREAGAPGRRFARVRQIASNNEW